MQPFFVPDTTAAARRRKPSTTLNLFKIEIKSNTEGKLLKILVSAFGRKGRFIKTPNFLIQLSTSQRVDNNQLILFKHKTSLEAFLGYYHNRIRLEKNFKPLMPKSIFEVNFSWICISGSLWPIQFKSQNIWCTKWILGRELHAMWTISQKSVESEQGDWTSIWMWKGLSDKYSCSVPRFNEHHRRVEDKKEIWIQTWCFFFISAVRKLNSFRIASQKF